MGQRITEWTPERQAFRSISDNASLIVWMCESDGHCFYVNPLWYQYTGQLEGTALGRGWLRAIHPDDLDIAHEAYRLATRKQSPFIVDYRLRHHGGYYYQATAYGSPYFGREGAYHGYVSSVVPCDQPMPDAATKPPSVLSRREKEVIACIARGKTDDEAGDLLGISGRTIEFHLHSAAIKLNAVNRVQTVVEAIRRGEVSL